MVLNNASNRARYVSSIVNQNQGGGNKKAGLKPTVGIDSWGSVFYKSVDPVNGRCCKLSKMQMTLYPNVVQSRNIDSRPVNYTSR